MIRSGVIPDTWPPREHLCLRTVAYVSVNQDLEYFEQAQTTSRKCDLSWIMHRRGMRGVPGTSHQPTITDGAAGPGVSKVRVWTNPLVITSDRSKDVGWVKGLKGRKRRRLSQDPSACEIPATSLSSITLLQRRLFASRGTDAAYRQRVHNTVRLCVTQGVK